LLQKYSEIGWHSLPIQILKKNELTKEKYMKFKIFYFTILLTYLNSHSQSRITRVLWNKLDNLPVEYATINSNKNYTISNENGVFEFEKTLEKITIQNIAYKKLELDYDYLFKNDTIYIEPNVYNLDEVIIEKDSEFNNMLKTILTDYALEPHQEIFFLRASIKKNNELYKIVDFSGHLEKETLFDTSTKPMPKKNYIVQIDNIRKAGFENREYDFELFNFKTLLNRIVSIYLNPKIYNLSYEKSNISDFIKINVRPKDISKTSTIGYYLVNESNNTFNEAYILSKNKDAEFDNIRDVKFRTPFFELKSNFKRNTKTNKLQLNQAIIKSKTEVLTKNGTDIFEVNYIFYANPIYETVKIKNNIKLTKDMFELKGKYDSKYWENNEILLLTKEMQEFINKVNISNNKSDFRTQTNMK
jgi:hypothetical protein